MNKIKFLLVVAFLVVLAAGAVVGMAIDRRLRTQTTVNPQRHHQGPWERINLSPEQREKMRIIWSDVDQLRKSRFEDRHQINQKRDQGIQDLLTPDQRTKYDAIQADYRAQVDAVEKKLQDAVHNAEDLTHAMLSPDQQKIYDDIRSRVGPPGMRRGGPRGGRGRPFSSPTTRPIPQVVQ